jgi:hypothetical protein
MNPPSLFILLAESGATVVAYILLIAGPLLALFFSQMNFELRCCDSNVKVFFVRSVMNCGSC